MVTRGTDEWNETYCDRRFHPPYLTGTLAQDGRAYWYYCRLEPGHDGDCDCEAAREAAAEAGLHEHSFWSPRERPAERRPAERRCIGCDWPLKPESEFTPAWADGDNPDAYITCSSCGYENTF